MEIYFAMFYHFYHGLLYWSMDRHGSSVLSIQSPDCPFPTGESPGNPEKEHHLVLINIQFGVN